MKIAIYSVLNLDNGAGGEKWIEQVSTRLHAQGDKILVLTTKHGNNNDPAIKRKLVENGIEVLEFDNYKKPFKIPKIQYIKSIANILKDSDVLYFNNAFALNEVFLYLIKKIINIKIVSGYHGTYPETGSIIRRIYHRIINRSVSRQFDGHHVLNKERENMLLSWGYRNVYNIANGVDTTRFSPCKKDDIFTVMFAGSMTHQKGIDRFAKAIESINRRDTSNNDIRFIIFGSGPLSYISEKLKEKFTNVEYFGYAYEEQLVKAYKKSHVFVAPSRFEEFGLVNLEAQAAGTPVTASDIPGVKQIVMNGATGFLVNSNITDEIIQSILYFKDLWYNKPEDYNRYSLSARSEALRYDWAQVTKKLKDTLSTIAENRQIKY